MSASDRGGRICLPPEKRGAAISADIVGGNGRCRWRDAAPNAIHTMSAPRHPRERHPPRRRVCFSDHSLALQAAAHDAAATGL